MLDTARDFAALALGAIALTTLGACARGDSAGDDAGSTVAAATYETMPRLALVPGVTFCAHREEACQFEDINTAAVGPDGRVALAGRSSEIMQFDSAGHLVRRIGRDGRGPGEYRIPAALTYDSAGTLTVFDAGTFRLVRFDSAGGPLTTARVPLVPGTQDMGFVGNRLVFAVLPPAAAIGDSVDARFVGVDSTGAPMDTLGRAPAHAVSANSAGLAPYPALFSRFPQSAIGHDGALYFAQGTALRITRADGAAPRVVVDMAIAPPPVTGAELDSARAAMLARKPIGPMPPGALQVMRQQNEAAVANAATVHPMIADLVALDDGTLWARETVAAAPDSIRWNGFDDAGHPLGYILLPIDADVLAGTRERLLIVMHDADDVPSATWFAVRGSTSR